MNRIRGDSGRNGTEEFAKIMAYLKKGLRMYTFLKRAALEFIERHP